MLEPGIGKKFVIYIATFLKVPEVGFEGRQLIFLPQYTPQLNPIEEGFIKWKQQIREESCENHGHLMIAIKPDFTEFLLLIALDIFGTSRHIFQKLCKVKNFNKFFCPFKCILFLHLQTLCKSEEKFWKTLNHVGFYKLIGFQF